RDMTVDLAKVFPAVRRQSFFAARERNAAEQEKIARRNRRDRPGAELREKSGAPHRATKQYEERRAQQENRAQKEQHDQGREMRSRRGNVHANSLPSKCVRQRAAGAVWLCNLRVGCV